MSLHMYMYVLTICSDCQPKNLVICTDICIRTDHCVPRLTLQTDVFVRVSTL